jgi:hypothetical protein
MITLKNQVQIDMWHSSNARQQTYMQAIFVTVQAQEQTERLHAAI